MTTQTTAVVGPTTSVDPTAGFRRTTTALALPLAFVFQAACNALYAAATTSGLSDTGRSAETLRFYAQSAGLMQWATVLALVGCLLLIPGITAALRVLRPARPRLALWAAVLMVVGYVSYFGIVMTNFVTIALGTLHPDDSDVLDAAQSLTGAAPWFVLFVIGNMVGTLLLGLAILLSRQSVPWWSGALVLAWPVAHIVGLGIGVEWVEVAGGTLEVIGLCVVARLAWRLPNADWVSRG